MGAKPNIAHRPSRFKTLKRRTAATSSHLKCLLYAKMQVSIHRDCWKLDLTISKADFEMAKSDRRRLKCLVCSTALRPVEFLATSTAAHRRSDKHKSALASRIVAAAPVIHAPNIPPIPAAMNLPECFDDFDNNFYEEAPSALARPLENLFSGTVAYGGDILDSDGHQVMFSAGEVPVDHSAEGVWKAMQDLEYVDHTTFADMTPMMADLFDKTDDCMVSEAVRAMAAMGELHPSDGEHL